MATGDLINSLNKLLAHLLISIVIPTRTTALTLPSSVLLSIFESLIEARFQDILKTPTAAHSAHAVFGLDRSYATSSKATEVETEARILEFLERSLEEALDEDDHSVGFSTYKSTRHRKERIIIGLLRLGEMMGLETTPSGSEPITPPRFSSTPLPTVPRPFETPRTQRVSLRGVLDEVKRARALESDGNLSEGSHGGGVFLTPSKREVRERALRNWEAKITEGQRSGSSFLVERRDESRRVEQPPFENGIFSSNPEKIIEEKCTCKHKDDQSKANYLIKSSSTPSPRKNTSPASAYNLDPPIVSQLGLSLNRSSPETLFLHHRIPRQPPSSRAAPQLRTRSQDETTSFRAVLVPTHPKPPRSLSNYPIEKKPLRKRSLTRRTRDGYLPMIGDSEIETFEAENSGTRRAYDRNHSGSGGHNPLKREDSFHQVKLVEVPLVERGGTENVREGWEWTQVAATTSFGKEKLPEEAHKGGKEVKSKVQLRREYETRLEAEKDRLVEVLRKMKVKGWREQD